MNFKNRYLKIFIISFIFFSCTLIWHFNIGCLFSYMTHYPCLSCGMTRALLALLNGDLKLSFEMHPMLWSVPILGLMFLFDDRFFNEKYKKKSIVLLVLILFGFLFSYITKIF